MYISTNTVGSIDVAQSSRPVKVHQKADNVEVVLFERGSGWAELSEDLG